MLASCTLRGDAGRHRSAALQNHRRDRERHSLGPHVCPSSRETTVCGTPRQELRHSKIKAHANCGQNAFHPPQLLAASSVRCPAPLLPANATHLSPGVSVRRLTRRYGVNATLHPSPGEATIHSHDNAFASSLLYSISTSARLLFPTQESLGVAFIFGARDWLRIHMGADISHPLVFVLSCCLIGLVESLFYCPLDHLKARVQVRDLTWQMIKQLNWMIRDPCDTVCAFDEEEWRLEDGQTGRDGGGERGDMLLRECSGWDDKDRPRPGHMPRCAVLECLK